MNTSKSPRPTWGPSPLALLLPAFLAMTSACASTRTPSFLVNLDRRPETRALPPVPEEDPLKDDAGNAIAPDEWVEAYEPESCIDLGGRAVPSGARPCPSLNLRPGILMSEARAFRAARTTIRYREMRTLYESDRMVWDLQRSLYEATLKLADEHIKSLQPGWWEKNAFTVGAVGGFVLGAAVAAGIAVGVYQAAHP